MTLLLGVTVALLFAGSGCVAGFPGLYGRRRRDLVPVLCRSRSATYRRSALHLELAFGCFFLLVAARLQKTWWLDGTFPKTT